MITPELARTYHCPRWNELPAVPLYMDQVITVVKDALSIFSDDDEALVTPAMINNYVKQKLIEPAEKKKYGRHQVSRLIVVNLFKQVFSMQEILQVISALVGTYGIEAAYNMFCDDLEELLTLVFEGEQNELTIDRTNQPPRQLLRTALLTLMGKIAVTSQLHDMGGE